MAKKDFPNLLHVTVDEERNSEKFLLAHKGGVYAAAVAGETVECALYKLVKVGKVIAPPSFQP